MIKNNRKGFTITELVIVIAVIAILAAVLIPTFSGVVTKANQNAELQKVRSAYTQYMADNAESGNFIDKAKVEYSGYWIKIENGACEIVPSDPGTGYVEVTISDNTIATAPTEAAGGENQGGGEG